MGIKRVILIVLDSVGIGELPDAEVYGDKGANTVGHISDVIDNFRLPNLQKLGLGNIEANTGLESHLTPTGFYGKANEQSAGKDTTTGHWEISGLILRNPFPTFPNGFPDSFMEKFEENIGTKTIGNKVASGTEIIDELGAQHVHSGHPIIYTSADSVFQIAMHEDVIPIKRQYEICCIAREMLVDDYAVGRVIARPFVGTEGTFNRTANRKDFSLLPLGKTVLDQLKEAGKEVAAVGKINDIFAGQGITQYKKTADNMDGVDVTLAYMQEDFEGLIFTNLVDFDMHYGHRRDPEGYANCLKEFDDRLPEIIDALKEDDMLIITADHGNDPTAPGTDHTREYIPIIGVGEQLGNSINIGTRESFADIAATIAEALEVGNAANGSSFLSKILKY